MLFTNQQNKRRFFNIGLIFLLSGSCFLSVACQTKEQKSAATLKQCQSFLNKDDVSGASTCYAEAVAANPENGGEISKAGKIAVFDKCVEFKERKDYKNAIICFDGFIALEPEMANNYFQLADSYYEYFKVNAKATGQPDSELLDRAEEAIKTGLKIRPEDASAHSLYGQILMDKNDKQQSLKEHLTAVKLSPNTYIHWIFYLIAQERFDEDKGAIESCQKALSLQPDDPTATNLLGKLYEKTGKINEAIDTFEKLLKIQPDYDYDAVKKKLENLKKNKELDEQTKNPKKKAKAVSVPNSHSNL